MSDGDKRRDTASEKSAARRAIGVMIVSVLLAVGTVYNTWDWYSARLQSRRNADLDRVASYRDAVTLQPCVQDGDVFGPPFYVLSVDLQLTGVSRYEWADADVTRGMRRSLTPWPGRARSLVFVASNPPGATLPGVPYRRTPAVIACFVDVDDPARRHVELGFAEAPHFQYPLPGDGARAEGLAAVDGSASAGDRLVAAILERLPERNSADVTGFTHAGAVVGDVSSLQGRGSPGEGVDERDECGATPLQRAAAAGAADAVGALLDAGADMGAADDAGISPLHAAALAGRVDCMRQLLQSGASVAARARACRLAPAMPAGATPLHLAAIGGSSQAIDALLRSHADLNAVDTEGRTPLLCAIIARRERAVEALLDAGADPEICGGEGRTPLHVAAVGGNVAAARALLNAGAATSATDAKGDTPLHLAASRTATEVVALLLDAGADPDLPGYLGRTPYSIARASGDQELIGLMIAHGAAH